jgi:arylsulfatase A-like enzyme
VSVLTNSPTDSLRGRIAIGAVFGASAWLALAAVEYVLWSLTFQFSRSYCSNTSLGWAEDLEILACYPIVGALTGAVSAALFHKLGEKIGWLGHGPSERSLDTLASATLALATSAGVALQIELRGMGRALFLAPLGLGFGLLALTLWTWRGHRRAPGTSPWFVSALLLGVPWLATRPGFFRDARTPIYGASLLCLCIWGASILIGQRRKDPDRVQNGPEQRVRPIRRLAWAASAAALAVLVGAALALAAHLPGIGERVKPDAASPNVLLIVLDTARAQEFSLYGYGRDTTPNIARFSRDATVFTNAISASNYTLSSHASLFTGLLPTSHGAHPKAPGPRSRQHAGEPGLAARFVTLAEMLAGRGYYTAASISNFLFLSQGYNLDQGFERFAVLSYRCAAPSPRPLLARIVGRQSVDERVATPYHNASQVNHDVFDLLGRLTKRPQRFFLFINYMDVHFPYSPPSPFDVRFPGKGAPIDRDQYFELRNAVLRGDRTLTPSERDHLISQYDGALAYLDVEVGELLERLKQLRIYDNTLIVITADHGEAFGEKGYLEHGTSLYQDQIHVPLIVKYPNSDRKGVVDDFVSTIDIVPTVLQRVALPQPAALQGRDLQSLPATPRPIISEAYPREAFQGLGTRYQHVSRAIFQGRFKLIASSADDLELYDLGVDPKETRNLEKTQTQEGDELKARLAAWLSAASPQEGGAPVTDPETLERLRSLGYIK